MAPVPMSSPAPQKLNGKAIWKPFLNSDSAPRAEFAFDPMDEAIAAFRNGEFLVVMDDEGRENEGDLIIAASQVTTEKMAWMIKYTRYVYCASFRPANLFERSSGFICIALPGDRLQQLEIPMMTPDNQERHKTAYTITVDYKHGKWSTWSMCYAQYVTGTTTGISAHDRALTARSLASPHTTASDFCRPGHLVPLRAVDGGVLVRRGHTETGVDLCLLAGLPDRAGVLCELVEDNAEGSMMRRDGCRVFADRWGIKMISVEMVAQMRKELGL